MGNNNVLSDHVRAMRSQTRARIETELAQISQNHNVTYEIKSVSHVLRIVIGGSSFPCQRVDLCRKSRNGVYLTVDGEMYGNPSRAADTRGVDGS